MNCLQNLSRCSLGHVLTTRIYPKMHPAGHLGVIVRADRRRGSIAMNAHPSSSDTEKSSAEVDKSEIYSNDMTQAMGAVLTYRHELGMNYDFILPDLIVGSCLQTPSDVDTLRSIGVKTVFCLQQDSDLEYFGVDIGAIREYAMHCGDIEHLRAEIRDFDAFNLRVRLPAVMNELNKAIKRNGGVTYIHCTAGLGRAPAVASTYMFWILGYGLGEAHQTLLSKRPCFPKLDAIKGATADILTGMSKIPVTLTWKADESSSVEVSGLDIGWGQRIPLTFDEERCIWVLKRELAEGVYEYKYIIDGEWTCNAHELLTSPNRDGHVNNYVQVFRKDEGDQCRQLRQRLASENIDLTEEERQIITDFLDSFNDKQKDSSP